MAFSMANSQAVFHRHVQTCVLEPLWDKTKTKGRVAYGAFALSPDLTPGTQASVGVLCSSLTLVLSLGLCDEL